MVKSLHPFQIFVKPAGARCNLSCRYCYYLEKDSLFSEGHTSRMPEILLEEYIVQHIEASPETVIRFSWHGGEPTILGLDYFRKIISLQKKHIPPGRRFANGIQTNGTLLDESWGRFLAEEGFSVGLSLDGPQDIHNRYRRHRNGRASFKQALRGYEILRRYGVNTDILCVVNQHNSRVPLTVYGFFKEIGASYITFLPCVDRQPDGLVFPFSVQADAWGKFLCTIFDEWMDQDIGRIKVQIFEEAARTAFRQEHSLCIFRPACGDIPVLENNGDLYACDHFVDRKHLLGNIIETPLVELLKKTTAFGRLKKDSLPRFCRQCEVLDMCNGGCPKNRFVETPDGETGLNYLCSGYRRFFNHCRPWVDAVSDEWRRRKS